MSILWREEDLHDLLMAAPELIEEGLIFKKHEVVLGQEARCDLHFIDRLGKDLYVEVKSKAGDQAVGQIIKYKIANGKSVSARYMVAAQDFERYTIASIISTGFEYCIINPDDIKPAMEKYWIKELKHVNKAKAAEMFTK